MGRYMKALQNPAIIGVLLGLLLMCNGCVVLASSGGAMGGDFFSSDSYGSWGSSSSSSSYNTYQSYSIRKRAPKLSNSDPNHVPTQSGGGGPSVTCVFLIVLVLAAFCVVGGCFLFIDDEKTSVVKKASILKLQVGLSGTARSLQRELNRIAEAADTSTPKGVTYMLQESALALLRHTDYCFSGYSFVDVKRSIEEVQKLYNLISTEERGKFGEETVVNINSIMRKQSATTQRSNDFHNNEYIVITIIVAAEGVHKLPLINSRANLEGALKKLGTITSSRLKAAQVLWTPQNENDILTKQEYIEDYPLLTRV